MNSTQIHGSSSGWIKESDCIGGLQEYKSGTFTTNLACTKFWFYVVAHNHLQTVTITYDGVTASLIQTGPRNNGILMYESPVLEYISRQIGFSVSSNPIMLYTIYYEIDLSKETPIPISIVFLVFKRTGSFRCGGNHLSSW